MNFKTQVHIFLKFIIWPCFLLESKRKQGHIINLNLCFKYHAASFSTVLHDVDFTLLVSENLYFYFANVFYKKKTLAKIKKLKNVKNVGKIKNVFLHL
jgi:hypothetical protein